MTDRELLERTLVTGDDEVVFGNGREQIRVLRDAYLSLRRQLEATLLQSRLLEARVVEIESGIRSLQKFVSSPLWKMRTVGQ